MKIKHTVNTFLNVFHLKINLKDIFNGYFWRETEERGSNKGRNPFFANIHGCCDFENK